MQAAHPGLYFQNSITNNKGERNNNNKGKIYAMFSLSTKAQNWAKDQAYLAHFVFQETNRDWHELYLLNEFLFYKRDILINSPKTLGAFIGSFK